MGSVTVRQGSGDLLTIVFSNLQEGEWISKESNVIRIWIDDTSYIVSKNGFPNDESWEMVLQATDLEST